LGKPKVIAAHCAGRLRMVRNTQYFNATPSTNGGRSLRLPENWSVPAREPHEHHAEVKFGLAEGLVANREDNDNQGTGGTGKAASTRRCTVSQRTHEYSKAVDKIGSRTWSDTSLKSSGLQLAPEDPGFMMQTEGKPESRSYIIKL